MLPTSRFEWANELPADPGTAKLTAVAKLISMRDGSRDGHRQADLPTVVTEFYKYMPPEMARAVAQNWGKTCGPPPLTEKEIDEYCDRHEKWRNRNFTAEQPVATSFDPVAEVSIFTGDLLAAKPRSALLPTGFPILDKVLRGGSRPGDVVYIAAMRGTGKSVFALQASTNASREGRVGLYNSLEMTAQAQRCRQYGQIAGMPVSKFEELLYGERAADQIDMRAIHALQARIAQWPLSIRDDLTSLDAIEQAVAARPGLEYIVIDQLHHLQPPTGVTGMAALEANSRGLVLLAKKYKVVIYALCQINRPDELSRKNPKWRPHAFSLRGSEQLAHDCDVLLYLYRERGGHVLEVNVNKGRGGGESEDWLPLEFGPVYCQVKPAREGHHVGS
jgi:hypothetical protein